MLISAKDLFYGLMEFDSLRLYPKTCLACLSAHGKIYGIYENPEPKPPLHPLCRCVIKKMEALRAGTATENKLDGADFWLKYMGYLPEYYLTESQAKKLGWYPKTGNFATVCPNKMLTRGIYKNHERHLPEAYGRIWYEADLNYKFGFRNVQRILWSNDGLIFVTYDHYKTFHEIV